MVLEENAPHLLGVRRRRVEECLHDLILTNDHLRIVEQRMSVAIHQGLSASGHATSSVRCYPTYVCRLPSGNMVGWLETYATSSFAMLLALDVGGTNFIMMETGRGWDGKPDMESDAFVLPKDIMTGTRTALFDHIAK